MTKRCHHEYETKKGYPDDLICHKYHTVWTITDYMKYKPTELMTLPKGIRYAVVKRQTGIFAKENPDYPYLD